jgi:hypothetical protein
MAFVGTLLPWLDRQFHDLNGDPLAHGFVESFITGTDTPKALYADALLTTPLANPAELDSEGRLTAFMQSGAYDFEISDANSVLLYTVEGVEDYGATYLGQLGVQLAQGSSLVTSGYTVLPTDTLVTVNSTGGPNPCIINLPNVTAHPLPLTIKNMGTVALSVVPFSVQTIDGVNSAYTVTAASGANKPSIFLTNDGVSSFWIEASHKL